MELHKHENDLFNYHRNQLRKLTSTSKIQLQTADIMSKTIDLLNTNTTQIVYLYVRTCSINK
jgi:hypothetical protein